MKNILTALLMFCAMLFIACNDKDSNSETDTTCSEECVAPNECKCTEVDGDTVCKCEPKQEECFCDEEKQVACPEGGKDACPKHEYVKCDPACTENQECKCEAEKCECKDKQAVTEKCDPAGTPACTKECKADEDCICHEYKWQCIPKNVEKSCDPTCKESENCVCSDEACECKEKDATHANTCDGKSENDPCGDKMTCKMEAEVLVCKADEHVPAEPAPTEPAPAE